MPFQRRILYHGSDPQGAPQLLSLTAVRSCWFELHRQGGCGSAEVILSDDFDLRNEIEIGDWISFEPVTGTRWYLGRVQERRAEVPARVRLRLEGMGIELNEVFPGGFGSQADGRKPHVYAATDLFDLDPDRGRETFDSASTAEQVVRLLLTQYLPAGTHIRYVPSLVEPPLRPAPLASLKVRGEESIRAILKDLALRAQSASWGVDEQGQFFFLRPRNDLLVTFQAGSDLTSLEETRDLEYLFNRILLTGDYVYDRRIYSGDVARRSFRWRGSYIEPISRGQFGDRRIRIWVPWIRTQEDAYAFAREFFRTYSQPSSRYFLETAPQVNLPVPWLGRVRALSADGQELITARLETIRVLFDQAPRFRLELGPEDPRNLWPEPTQDERWELPEDPRTMGGPVTLPTSHPGGGGGGGGGQSQTGGSQAIPSSSAPADSSGASSDGSGPRSSPGSSWHSSGPFSGSPGGSSHGGGWSFPSSLYSSAPGSSAFSSGDGNAGSSSPLSFSQPFEGNTTQPWGSSGGSEGGSAPASGSQGDGGSSTPSGGSSPDGTSGMRGSTGRPQSSGAPDHSGGSGNSSAPLSGSQPDSQAPGNSGDNLSSGGNEPFPSGAGSSAGGPDSAGGGSHVAGSGSQGGGSGSQPPGDSAPNGSGGGGGSDQGPESSSHPGNSGPMGGSSSGGASSSLREPGSWPHLSSTMP